MGITLCPSMVTRFGACSRVMEKLSASLVAALSAALLYRLLRRRAAPPVALLLTLAYAYGTTTWVISSQALWQHGMAELLVIGALLLWRFRAPSATAPGVQEGSGGAAATDSTLP